MASRSVEMEFKLAASLGKSYSSTLKEAQREIASVQQEVKRLREAQADISAFQKQEKAAENNRAKLASLQRQHELLEQQMKETTGSTTALEIEDEKLQQRILRTTTALEGNEQRMKQLSDALKSAGVDTGHLSDEAKRLQGELSGAQSRQDALSNSLKDGGSAANEFGSSGTAAVSQFQEFLAAAGIAATLKGIADGLMDCVKAAGDFEAEMSNVEALSGSDQAQMAALTNKAKELGATTKFTALESAQAMGYMGMAGWDAEQMLYGMNGVLQLAAASGEDLAMVSDIVTDNLTAFGLTAADTAHFADVLAAAATNSNTSVGIMGETFKGSAAVAGALGYTIEDVAVMVGLMANAGVKGSNANTALKNTFNGLLKGVTLTGEAFGEYEYSAVNADGTMKDLAATVSDLRGYFEQMTEAERVSNAMAIAGQRGYNGLLAVLNATDADYQSLSNSINNCSGAAEKMAKIKMDNLNGQVTLLESAWDGLRITLGEEFEPEMRGVASLLTDVTGDVSEFIRANPGLVKGIAAAAGVIGTVTVGLTAYAAAAKIAAAANALFNYSIPGAGQILAVTAALAGVVGVVVALSNSLEEQGVPTVEELTAETRELRDAIEDAASAADSAVADTIATTEVAGRYIDKMEELQSTGLQTTEQQREYNSTVALLLEVMPELADQISATTDEYGRITYATDADTEALRQNTEAIKQNAIQQAYQEQMTQIRKEYGDVLIEEERNQIRLAKATETRDNAEKRLSELQKKRLEILDEQNRLAEESFKQTGEFADATLFMVQELADVDKAISDTETEIYLAGQSVNSINRAIEENKKSVEEADEAIRLTQEAIDNLTGSADDNTDALAGNAAQVEAVQDALAAAKGDLDELVDAYETAYDSAYKSIDGQFGLFEEAKVKVKDSVDDMIKSLESQSEYMSTYSENLRRAAEMGLSDGLIAQLSDGSKESAAYLQAIVKGGEDKISELNKAFADVEQGKKDFSTTVGKMQTDFDAKLEDIKNDLEAAVEDMDLHDEAAQSAKDTIDGFILGAEERLPDVKQAYAEVAKAASDAINGTLDIHSPSRVTQWSSEMAVAGFVKPATENRDRVREEYASMAQAGAEGIREQVQENMQIISFMPQIFQQPQTVAPASAPIAESASTGVQINLTVEYNITGDTGDGLQERLEESTGRIKEVVRNAIEEIMDDRGRTRL